MKRSLIVALSFVLLTACASPETRVRTGLMKAGLAEPVAACMATRMVDRLSLVQLRRLQALSSVGEMDMGKTSADQFLHKVRALKDPEILSVTTKSAIICSLTR
jgi:predicted Zn-dependent protease